MNTQIIHKAYKFRLYPNEDQKIFIKKSVGSCRFVYNHFLSEKSVYYNAHKNDKKKSLSFVETEHLLTLLKQNEQYSWLKDINSQSLQFSLRNLDSAYSRFFKKLGSFPRFKKKTNTNSFTVPQFFKITDKDNKWLYLKIPKLKQPLKVRKSQNLPNNVLYCTISKTPTEKYFVSFTCKQEIPIIKNKLKKAVGIDVGIKEFAFTSDNEIIKNDKNIKRKEKRRKILQRKIAKSKKGSNNRKTLVKKLAVKYEKETNIKRNFIHQASNYFIKNHDIIITEDLNVKGMLKNHKLAKAISYQNWGEFFRQLEYKSLWNNKVYYQIDRWFPSSKMCSNCGQLKKDLKLSDRTYNCDCGLKIDRDLNAAINIKNLGLSDLAMAGTAKSHAFGRAKVTDMVKITSVRSIEKGNPTL